MAGSVSPRICIRLGSHASFQCIGMCHLFLKMVISLQEWQCVFECPRMQPSLHCRWQYFCCGILLILGAFLVPWKKNCRSFVIIISLKRIAR